MDNQKTDLSPHEAYIAMCAKMGVDPDTMKPVTDYDGCSDDAPVETKPRIRSKYLLAHNHPEFIYNMYVIYRLDVLDYKQIKLKKHDLHIALLNRGHRLSHQKAYIKLTDQEKDFLKKYTRNEIKKIKLNILLRRQAMYKRLEMHGGFADWRQFPFDVKDYGQDTIFKPLFSGSIFNVEFEQRQHQGMIANAEYFESIGVKYDAKHQEFMMNLVHDPDMHKKEKRLKDAMKHRGYCIKKVKLGKHKPSSYLSLWEAFNQ